MQNVRAVASRLAFLALLSLAACGDDNAPGAPVGEDEDADILPRDATVEASAAEAGLDGAVEDASVPDGSTVSECTGDALEFKVANGDGRPFSVSIHKNRIHMVYMVPAGGKSYADSTLQGIRYVSFDTTGMPSDAADIVNATTNDYFKTRDPALVVRSSGADPQLDLFFTSNGSATSSSNVFELYYKDLTAGTAEQPQTTNANRNEFYTVAAPFAGGSAALFSDELLASTPAAVGLLKAKNTTPATVVAESDMHATSLAFAELNGGAAMAFVSSFPSVQDPSKVKTGIFSQALTSAGDPQGNLVSLSTSVGGRSQVELATISGDMGISGGALFFTEAPGGTVHQLRFRELDKTGVLTGPIRNLTSANIDMHEFAVSPYSKGYVIAYRRTGGIDGFPASIYLMFIDAQGNESGKRLVRGVSGSAGGLDVLVANDGRIVVVWADTEQVTSNNKPATEVRVRAARLTCL